LKRVGGSKAGRVIDVREHDAISTPGKALFADRFGDGKENSSLCRRGGCAR